MKRGGEMGDKIQNVGFVLWAVVGEGGLDVGRNCRVFWVGCGGHGCG